MDAYPDRFGEIWTYFTETFGYTLLIQEIMVFANVNKNPKISTTSLAQQVDVNKRSVGKLQKKITVIGHKMSRKQMKFIR